MAPSRALRAIFLIYIHLLTANADETQSGCDTDTCFKIGCPCSSDPTQAKLFSSHTPLSRSKCNDLLCPVFTNASSTILFNLKIPLTCQKIEIADWFSSMPLCEKYIAPFTANPNTTCNMIVFNDNRFHDLLEQIFDISCESTASIDLYKQANEKSSVITNNAHSGAPQPMFCPQSGLVSITRLTPLSVELDRLNLNQKSYKAKILKVNLNRYETEGYKVVASISRCCTSMSFWGTKSRSYETLMGRASTCTKIPSEFGQKAKTAACKYKYCRNNNCNDEQTCIFTKGKFVYQDGSSMSSFGVIHNYGKGNLTLSLGTELHWSVDSRYKIKWLPVDDDLHDVVVEGNAVKINDFAYLGEIVSISEDEILGERTILTAVYKIIITIPVRSRRDLFSRHIDESRGTFNYIKSELNDLHSDDEFIGTHILSVQDAVITSITQSPTEYFRRRLKNRYLHAEYFAGGFLIFACEPVEQVRLSSNMDHNGTCYQDAIITAVATSTTKRITGFLDRKTNIIKPYSIPIPCSAAHSLYYAIGHSFYMVRNGMKPDILSAEDIGLTIKPLYEVNDNASLTSLEDGLIQYTSSSDDFSLAPIVSLLGYGILKNGDPFSDHSPFRLDSGETDFEGGADSILSSLKKAAALPSSVFSDITKSTAFISTITSLIVIFAIAGLVYFLITTGRIPCKAKRSADDHARNTRPSRSDIESKF